MIYRPVTGPTRRRIAFRIKLGLGLLAGLALPVFLTQIRAQAPDPASSVTVVVAAQPGFRPERRAEVGARSADLPAQTLTGYRGDCAGYARDAMPGRPALRSAGYPGLARLATTLRPWASATGARPHSAQPPLSPPARSDGCTSGWIGL
tara:strand:+ start:3617 stop:4063 length:447 start_codon:yes stop_codon:yes gene_type:complete